MLWSSLKVKAVPAVLTVSDCPAVPIALRPVPPFATLSVPDSVTVPEVEVLGVKPVVPAENVVVAGAAAHAGVPELFVKMYPLITPLVVGTIENDDHVGTDPFEVNTVPFAPIASRVTAPEPVA